MFKLAWKVIKIIFIVLGLLLLFWLAFWLHTHQPRLRRYNPRMAITIEQARLWYASADPVHDFEHVLRVYQLRKKSHWQKAQTWRLCMPLPCCTIRSALPPAGTGKNALGTT